MVAGDISIFDIPDVVTSKDSKCDMTNFFTEDVQPKVSPAYLKVCERNTVKPINKVYQRGTPYDDRFFAKFLLDFFED